MANAGVFLLKMTIKISMIIEEVVMKYLSVSEFANMFNVSRQTLIYYDKIDLFKPVSYTHLTLPTKPYGCRSRWSPYH